MEIPSIPSFDDVVKSLLLTLGVSAPIVGIVGLVNAIRSWVQALKMGWQGATVVGRGVRAAAQYRPVAGMLSVLVTLLVPVAQLLTLPLIYIGGNYTVMQWSDSRWNEFQRVVAKIPPVESFGTLLDMHWYSAVYSSVAPFLRLDRFTMGYLMVAVLVMLLSYPLAWRDETGSATWRLGCLLAAPTMVLFAIALVVLAWALVLTVVALAVGLLGLLISGEFEFVTMEAKYWLGMLAVFVTSIAYFCACQAAVFAPRYIHDVWRKPGPDLDPDPEPTWRFGS